MTERMMLQITRIQWSKLGITVYSNDGFVCRLEDSRDRYFLDTVIIHALRTISDEQVKRRQFAGKEPDNATQEGTQQQNTAGERAGDDRSGARSEASGSSSLPAAASEPEPEEEAVVEPI